MSIWFCFLSVGEWRRSVVSILEYSHFHLVFYCTSNPNIEWYISQMTSQTQGQFWFGQTEAVSVRSVSNPTGASRNSDARNRNKFGICRFYDVASDNCSTRKLIEVAR